MPSSMGDLPNLGIEPRSPTLQADSLPSEPPGKSKNTGVGSLSLLQGIFQTQESNQGLLHCRQILYQLSHQESPRTDRTWRLTERGEELGSHFLLLTRAAQRWSSLVTWVTHSWFLKQGFSSATLLEFWISYAGQEATVRTGHGTTDWFQIGKGVHQGCILSPCLFNLYAEYIMRNTGLEEAQAGIKIAGRNINNLRYADDTTLMAESEEELKSS